MSKELIARLRADRFEFNGDLDLEAADLIEQQQSWIASLEQNARDADRMYKELETEWYKLHSSYERQRDELAASQAQIKVLREALENCRLLAARHRKEEWAPHILRFCESGGSVANPLRQDDSALRELLKAERERCAKRCEKIDVAAFGSDRPAPNDCANAIRAMEGQ